MIDRERLIKLMMMTTSSNDGEALAAVRKANSLLASEKTNWHDFIKAVPKPRPPPKPMGRGVFETQVNESYTDPDIPRMLQSLLRDVKGDFRNTIWSISNYWHENGRLSRKQYETVVNAYERLK